MDLTGQNYLMLLKCAMNLYVVSARRVVWGATSARKLHFSVLLYVHVKENATNRTEL